MEINLGYILSLKSFLSQSMEIASFKPNGHVNI